MKQIIAPEHISEEAKAFYGLEMPEVPDIDFSSSSSVQLLRDAVIEYWQVLSAQIPMDYRFDPFQINGINSFQITPPQITVDDAVILYVHGGSYCSGHPELCKNIPVSIAHAAKIPVISIEYRLAPEHPFPAPIEDVLQVIEGLVDMYGEKTRFALVGHSAGGGLALSVALQAKQRKLPLPECLALLAPWVDASVVGDSILTLESFDPNPPSLEWLKGIKDGFASNYDVTNPIVSPLYAKLSGLPPIYIQQPGRDRLLSDSTRLNRKLLEEGVLSTLDIWDGMWHGFQMFPLVPEAQQANRATANFISRILKSS